MKHVKRPAAQKAGSTIAIVGGESLLGKEIRDVLESRGLPARVHMMGPAADSARSTEASGEAAILVPLRLEELAAAKAVVLAGTPESSRKAMELLEGVAARPVIVDVLGALEDNPAARLRAPQVEGGAPQRAGVHVVGHPAAIALTLILKQLRRAGPISQCLAHIFEPASERGQRGLDELQQQTTGLLSFKKLKQEVYDAQVSFNLLPRWGKEAPLSLEQVELTIDKHLASLLASHAPGVPMPSLRLVQAPVFHGYSVSLWVEFEKNPGTEAVAEALRADLIEVRGPEDEAPTNVGVAGHNGITVGAMAPDRNQARACWFWLVADNLRIAAENTVGVVSEALG